MYQLLFALIFSFSIVSHGDTQTQICDFDSNIEFCSTSEVLDEITNLESSLILKWKLINHIFSVDPENEDEGQKILQTLYKYSQKEDTHLLVRWYILYVLDEKDCDADVSDDDVCAKEKEIPSIEYLLKILKEESREGFQVGAAEQLVEYYGNSGDPRVAKALNPFLENESLTNSTWTYFFELQSENDLLPDFKRLISLLIRYRDNTEKSKALVSNLEKSHDSDLIDWASKNINNNSLKALAKDVLIAVDSTESSADLLKIIESKFDFSIYEELILRKYSPAIEILLTRISNKSIALHARFDESERIEVLLTEETIKKVRDFLFSNRLEDTIISNLILSVEKMGFVKDILISEDQFKDENISVQLKSLYVKELISKGHFPSLVSSFFDTFRNHLDTRKLVLEQIITNAPKQVAHDFLNKIMSSDIDNFFKHLALSLSKGITDDQYRISLMMKIFEDIENNFLKNDIILEVYKTDYNISKQFLFNKKDYIVRNMSEIVESLIANYKMFWDDLIVLILEYDQLEMLYKKKLIRKLKLNARTRTLEKALRINNKELLKYVLDSLRKISDYKTIKVIKEMLSNGIFEGDLEHLVNVYLITIERSVVNNQKETRNFLTRSDQIIRDKVGLSGLIDHLELWQSYFEKTWRPSTEQSCKFTYRKFLDDLSNIESSVMKINLDNAEIKEFVDKVISVVEVSKQEIQPYVSLNQGICSRALGEGHELKGIYSKALGEGHELNGPEFLEMVSRIVSFEGGLLKEMLNYLAYKHLLGVAKDKQLTDKQFNTLKEYARKNRSLLWRIIRKIESEGERIESIFVVSEGEQVPTPNSGFSRYVFNWADTYVPRGIFSCPESSECILNIKGKLEMSPFSMFTSCPVVRDNGKTAMIPSLTLKANSFKNITVDTSAPLADGSCRDESPATARPVQAVSGTKAQAWKETIIKTRAIRYCALPIIKKKWGLRVSWCADHKTRYESDPVVLEHKIPATNGKTGYKGHDAGELNVSINENIDVDENSINGFLFIGVGGYGGQGGNKGSGIGRGWWGNLPDGKDGRQGIGGRGANLYIKRHNMLNNSIKSFIPAGNYGATIDTSNKDNFGEMKAPSPGSIQVVD